MKFEEEEIDAIAEAVAARIPAPTERPRVDVAEPTAPVMLPSEAAKYLRLGGSATYDLLRTGAIDGWRDANGRWRISRAPLDRCIARQEERQRRSREAVSATRLGS